MLLLFREDTFESINSVSSPSVECRTLSLTFV